MKICSDYPKENGLYFIATDYYGPQVWYFENGKWFYGDWGVQEIDYENPLGEVFFTNAYYVEVILEDHRFPEERDLNDAS